MLLCDGEPHHLLSSTISNKYGGYTNKHIIFGQSNNGFWMVSLNSSHKIRPTYSIKQLPLSLSKRPALTPWWSQRGPELWHFWQHNERETHMADTGWPWCLLVWPALVLWTKFAKLVLLYLFGQLQHAQLTKGYRCCVVNLWNGGLSRIVIALNHPEIFVLDRNITILGYTIYGHLPLSNERVKRDCNGKPAQYQPRCVTS